MTSKELRARAVGAIPGGVNSGQRVVDGCEELYVASTNGATFTDIDGKEFIDFHAAFGPPVLGHSDPDVDAAVTEAIRRQDLVGVGATELEVELAELLKTHIPSAERVLLTVTGSEATFHALRLARAHTGRSRIIKFQGCYHGWHDAVAMNVISPADLVGEQDLLSEGVVPEVADKTIVLPFNDLDAVVGAFDAYDNDIAAVIVEPIPHNIGAVLPQEGYLEGLRDLTSRKGALLIFDEVITGIRHGLGGIQGEMGVVPDLTTLGKAIANGYPLSAICGRADLMDLFSTTPGKPVFFAGTFNGHPATVSAAIATIRKLESGEVHEHIFQLGDRVRAELPGVYESHGLNVVVSGFGSVFVAYLLDAPVHSYSDLLRNDVEKFVGIRRKQMDSGVFELPLNLKRSHVSFAHSAEHIDRLLEAADKAIVSLS